MSPVATTRRRLGLVGENAAPERGWGWCAALGSASGAAVASGPAGSFINFPEGFGDRSHPHDRVSQSQETQPRRARAAEITTFTSTWFRSKFKIKPFFSPKLPNCEVLLLVIPSAHEFCRCSIVQL